MPELVGSRRVLLLPDLLQLFSLICFFTMWLCHMFVPPFFFLLSCLSSSSKFDSVGSSVKFLNGLKLLYFSCFDLLLS